LKGSSRQPRIDARIAASDPKRNGIRAGLCAAKQALIRLQEPATACLVKARCESRHPARLYAAQGLQQFGRLYLSNGATTKPRENMLL
jgi:hypothetical protein